MKKNIEKVFKDIKRWDVIKMFDKNIPGNSCVREETIPVSNGFTQYFAKSVPNMLPPNKGL